MVGGGTALAGGLEDEVELLADLLLADELAEVLGAQGRLDGLVVPLGGGADDARVRLGGAVVVPVHGGVFLRTGGQRARLRVCRAARSSCGTGAVPVSARAASACGVTALTASSASRLA